MEEKNYWRFCEDFTVVQASLLIIGEENPAVWKSVLNMAEQDRPKNFTAMFTALSHAIMRERLEADVYHYETDPGNYGNEMETDWNCTTVLREDLRDWLESRGFTTGFFFPQEDPQEDDAPDYLDENRKHYAPKLAAAVNAWQAVNEDPKLLVGRSVRQALEIWLYENASRYGLIKDDGKPNEQGIKEIAKISNWDFKGGAPRTPG